MFPHNHVFLEPEKGDKNIAVWLDGFHTTMYFLNIKASIDSLYEEYRFPHNHVFLERYINEITRNMTKKFPHNHVFLELTAHTHLHLIMEFPHNHVFLEL